MIYRDVSYLIEIADGFFSHANVEITENGLIFNSRTSIDVTQITENTEVKLTVITNGQTEVSN